MLTHTKMPGVRPKAISESLVDSEFRVCSLPRQPSIGYGPQPCPFWQKKETRASFPACAPWVAFDLRLLLRSKKTSWGFVFTTLPTWTTVSLCSWCKGGNMLAYVGRGCCFEVSNRFRKFALSQNSKLLLASESWMAGATVPPEVLQDVSGCKLLASAFGFGLVQYDLVGCPSFSYIH